MNKWKFVCLLLGLFWLLFFGWSIKGKFDEKETLSAHIRLVNEWNTEQAALQERYMKEVIEEEDTKAAMKALSSIIAANDQLLRRTEAVEPSFDALRLVLSDYQQGLHAMQDAYRFFYHALGTNEKGLLESGEEALEEAETHFRLHEKGLSKLAKRHFIQLQ